MKRRKEGEKKRGRNSKVFSGTKERPSPVDRDSFLAMLNASSDVALISQS